MKRVILYCAVAFTILSCTVKTKSTKTKEEVKKIPQNKMGKAIDNNLPTIGILIFEGVIINEVVAPLDVFSSADTKGIALFNVILIATEDKTYHSAHGLKVIPDYTISNVPKLKVLVVPSSYNPEDQTKDLELINFIKEQNKEADYIASHCAGAWLIGEAGIADNKEIVTYVTGGEYLKADYPNLKVADDSKVFVVQDGKFISSNGSLVSYLASFDLLEKLTSKEHREFVETSILFDRIKEK